MSKEAMKLALEQRITDYLSAGGLFNPELADHVAVRDLLMDCREALAEQQEPGRNHYEDGDVFERIAAMKRQPAQQEPVMWQYRDARDEGTWGAWLGCDKRLAENEYRQVRALYTSPPAQRKPLTDDELTYLWYNQSTDWMEFARAIEAKLKEKNNG